MTHEKKHTGFAIAIAWPETYCKQPGSWYDPITYLLGISKNHYYKVGHAALVLVDSKTQKCYYYDFGRYHSPYKHGRVRDANTDHELVVKTKPKISTNGEFLLNFNEILNELQNNEACHGEGKIHASYTLINFSLAHERVYKMQTQKHIAYGPFKLGGSNCSRFVCTAIGAGKPKLRQFLKLKYFVPLSPTPMSNVKALKHYTVIDKKLKTIPFNPINPLTIKQKTNTLTAPNRPENLPENAQWLSGEGAGSWFTFEYKANQLLVNRYSPEGLKECTGIYNPIRLNNLPELSSLRISYPSNCAEVTLESGNNTFKFERS